MAANTATRDEQLEQYGRLNAAEILLVWLLGDDLEVIDGLEDADVHVLEAQELFAPLFGKASGEGPVEQMVGVQTEALLARAFAVLATDDARRFFLDRAAYFGHLAAEHAAELIGHVQDGDDAS
jgi:hypothetical protein